MQIHRNNDHNKTHRSNTYHLEPWPVSSQNPSQKVKKQKSNNPCHVKNWVKSPCPPHSSFLCVPSTALFNPDSFEVKVGTSPRFSRSSYVFFHCICAGMSLSCSVTTLLYVFLKVKTVHENLKSPSALSIQSLSERSVLMCVWLLGWRSLAIRGSRSRMLTPPLRTPQVANPRGLVQSARGKKMKKINQSNHIFVRLHGDKLLGKKKIKIIKISFTGIDSICLLIVWKLIHVLHGINQAPFFKLGTDWNKQF